MRSTFGLAFVLGLLTSLTVATTDTGIVSDLPVFSTLESCFYLITQDNFTVDLQLENTDEYVPILSRAPIRLPEFKLTDGNLTTADGKFSAFLGPTSRIFPPPLIPLGFARGVPFLVTEFAAVAETIPSGIDVLRLVALEGPLVVEQLAQDQPIYVKPKLNTTPTKPLQITLVFFDT